MALALTGLLTQVVCFRLAGLAMKRGMNVGTTAIIMAFQPILVAALALLAGLALGFVGVLIVVLSVRNPVRGLPVAVALAVLAPFGIATATLLEIWHGLRSDPAVGGVVRYAVDFAVPTLCAAATEPLRLNLHPALAHLVVANSIVSVGLHIALLRRGDATQISSMLYLVPPLALIISWAILGGTLLPFGLAGLVLSVADVCTVTLRAEKGPPNEP